jgi:integrase
MIEVPKPILLGKLRCAVKGGVRRYRAADGTWYWQVCVRGRGGAQVDAFRDTVAGAEERLANLVSGRAHEAAERRRARTGACTTVEDLLRLWGGDVKLRTDLDQRTVDVYRIRARRLIPRLGRIHVVALTDADVEEYAHRLVREGYAERTARADVDTLRSAWRWARRRGHHDCMDLEPRLRAPKPSRTNYVPTDDEIRRTLAHLDGYHQDVLRLQWLTGARVGEIGHLHVADVDLARGGIWVGRHPGARKTGPRWVQCPKDAQRILRRLVQDAEGPLLWPVRAETASRAGERLTAACKRAKVPRWTSHGLRHRAADRLAEQGVDVVAAARHLGHSVQTMLRTYRRVQESQADAVAEALGRMGEHLEVVEGE